MTDHQVFSMDESQFRVGQRQAVHTIVDGVRQGRTNTAIVLPTRYGKTDVMRMAGLWLWWEKAVSRCLILEPDKALRWQVLKPRKWKEAIERYKVPITFPGGMPVWEVVVPPKLPFPPHEEIFIAITTQMANLHKGILAQWVDSELHRAGVPPIVFIDEAHMGSDRNDWGDTVEVLANAGAYVTLLTATPFRADRRRIPGFEVRETATRLVRVSRHRQDADTGEEWVDIYEGEQSVYELKAHYKRSFREAWDDESPSPLCKVSHRPFSIDLSKVFASTGELSATRLGDLPSSEVPRALMPALKDKPTILEACRILLQELANYRSQAPHTAAIVFVGNDEQSDAETNQHATNVRRAIHNLNAALDVRIATSADDDQGAQTIDSFAEGQGDILIVKQMASRGTDIDRLKVCLDLSNVRSPNAFIQRITRICTVWPLSSNPDDVIRTAVYISPDDIRARALFQNFIIDEGGESQVQDLTLVATKPAEERTPEEKPIYLPEDVGGPETFGDTDQTTVAGEYLPPTDRVFELLPELRRFRTEADIGHLIANGHIQVPLGEFRVRNMNEEEQKFIDRINDIAHQLTLREMKDRGAPYRRGDQESSRLYGSLSKRIWARHKRMNGVSAGKNITDIHDISALKRILESMRREYYGREATTA